MARARCYVGCESDVTTYDLDNSNNGVGQVYTNHAMLLTSTVPVIVCIFHFLLQLRAQFSLDFINSL